MTLTDSMDLLRGRYARCQRRRSLLLQECADSMGLYRETLQAFLRGDDVSMTTLRKIETWCDREERMHGRCDK